MNRTGQYIIGPGSLEVIQGRLGFYLTEACKYVLNINHPNDRYRQRAREELTDPERSGVLMRIPRNLINECKTMLALPHFASSEVEYSDGRITLDPRGFITALEDKLWQMDWESPEEVVALHNEVMVPTRLSIAKINDNTYFMSSEDSIKITNKSRAYIDAIHNRDVSPAGIEKLGRDAITECSAMLTGNGFGVSKVTYGYQDVVLNPLGYLADLFVAMENTDWGHHKHLQCLRNKLSDFEIIYVAGVAGEE